MQKSDKIKRNCNAVSGVIGEVLLTGIFVIALSSLSVYMYSIDGPEEVNRLTVEEWVDQSSNIIHLQHCGGESIDTENLKISVSINGNNYIYSPSDVSDNLGKDYWELADVIEINANEEWSADITDEDDVVVKLIDLDSNVVLPKYRIDVSPESNIYFRIYASAETGGSIFPDGMSYALLNDSITYSITPDSNYKILDVTVDEESKGPVSTYNFANISSDHTIVAEFTPIYFYINASAGPGGSIFPEGIIDLIQASSKTFSITPDSDYKILDVTVDNVSEGNISSYTFEDIYSNHSIHADFTPDFEIVNDTIIPKGSFISGFGMLGAAIQSGDDDLMVTARIKVGNDTFDPWGAYDQPVTGNVNDENTHSWDLPTVYPADTPITISGKSWIWNNDANHHSVNNDDWHTYMEVSSTLHPSNLKVLKNGDSVPDIPGLDEQPDIAEFVDDYVEDGKVVLEGNEAIFLFELGTTNLGSTAADFQDLVILVSVDSGEG